MKIFEKIRLENGSRYILLFGIKIISYSKRIKNKKISAFENKKLISVKNEFPNVISVDETVDAIINGASLCRYGDAEFDVCLSLNKNDPYQRPSKLLSKRLNEILNTPSTNKLLICIPPFNDFYNNPLNYYKNISFWEWYWMVRWKIIQPMIKFKEYGNSFVSRDSLFYNVNLEKIKTIWDNREVIFVVGRGSRFVFEKRLFDNIKHFDYIYTKPTHAFDDYDNLLKECLTFSKNKLFFIAAGPTATVLAYDLHKLGYQALDMGHLSNCYLEYLGEGLKPELIKVNS